MRLGKIFLGACGSVEGTSFVALGIIAHRLDLWIEWQLAIMAGALAAGLGALAFTLLRGRIPGPSTTRMHRYVEEVHDVDIRMLAQRIGGKTVLTPRGPHRSDGPIEGTNRP